ncbi:MAG: hypothetical protein RIR51_158 [Bacteroidota bacterium]|jgi:undecaprenyl diphosphate synthase
MSIDQKLIDKSNIPKHVAIIMDGNGRWAKEKGFKDRIFGHKNAIVAVREAIELSGEIGIEYLTLFAFSTENWNRPKTEVRALMELLISTIMKELAGMMEKNIQVKVIGDTSSLPSSTLKILNEAIEKTKNNTGLSLVLALSYSGKWDITQATKKIAEKVKTGLLNIEEITENHVAEELDTVGIPDPDLMIRTGGDHRISNFLLWQLAYCELYIIEDLYWPDFRKEHYIRAIIDFQRRERRFGKTSEQILDSTRNKI